MHLLASPDSDFLRQDVIDYEGIYQNGDLICMPPTTSNQTMQPTAGRSDAPLHIMKTRPLQATLALASDG
jgi:hypothetical protein